MLSEAACLSPGVREEQLDPPVYLSSAIFRCLSNMDRHIKGFFFFIYTECFQNYFQPGIILLDIAHMDIIFSKC